MTQNETGRIMVENGWTGVANFDGKFSPTSFKGDFPNNRWFIFAVVIAGHALFIKPLGPEVSFRWIPKIIPDDGQALQRRTKRSHTSGWPSCRWVFSAVAAGCPENLGFNHLAKWGSNQAREQDPTFAAWLYKWGQRPSSLTIGIPQQHSQHSSGFFSITD